MSMTVQQHWRNKQVAEKFGITPRLLIDLTEKGIVRADIDEGGRGKARLYSNENLFDLALYQELNSLNIGYRNIKQLIGYVATHEQKHTGLLAFRAKRNSATLWWNIMSEEEMLSKPNSIVSENDDIFETVGCATVIVDLRSISKMVELKMM
jgi:DNA-binding transcriptional MerR regulator